MTVNVSAADITLGHKLDSERCTVGFAIQRLMPSCLNIRVDDERLYCGHDVYAIPKDVSQWISHDHAGLWVDHAPFKFEATELEYKI